MAHKPWTAAKFVTVCCQSGQLLWLHMRRLSFPPKSWAASLLFMTVVCAWPLPEATSATVHTVWGLMSVGSLPQSLSVMANPTLLSSLSFSVHCLLYPPSDHGRLCHVITTIFVHGLQTYEEGIGNASNLSGHWRHYPELEHVMVVQWNCPTSTA